MMEELFSFYSDKVMQGKDEFQMFSKFFKEDRDRIREWTFHIWISTSTDPKQKKLQTIRETRWWAKEVALNKIFGYFDKPESTLYADVIDPLQAVENNIKINSDTRVTVKNYKEGLLKYENVITANYVERWVDSCLQKLHTKNDNKANELRCQGNEYYARKQFNKSLELYTKALCNATYESETYAVILANKSAVSYMMKAYKSCLKDINICMNCKCPENVQLKVHIRKIKCCVKMNKQEQLNSAVVAALEFLEKCTQVMDKDKARKDILTSSLEEPLENELMSEFPEELPKLKDGVNTNFLYASSAVRIDYDEQRGRHVVANKQLEPKDVLFVEKPFIFVLVFNENMELPLNKCYHCLRTIFSCIPCKSCTRCIFCNESCRDHSWREFHKWECVGMQTDLWYHIGIAFPALRVLIKGVKSQFCQLADNYEADMVTYGNESDNYGYFSKLVSNISKMKNVLPLIISATVVTLYLKKQTNFFVWLMDQPTCPKGNGDDLVLLVGGLLTRQIAQLQCNSSTVSHKDMNWEDREFASCDSVPVACAVYPSVAMMNHSCKPNISIYYSQDTVVVQASERIEANEEICNCYGIDHRFDNWASRQEQCNTLYYFKCQCRVCKFSSL